MDVFCSPKEHGAVAFVAGIIAGEIFPEEEDLIRQTPATRRFLVEVDSGDSCLVYSWHHIVQGRGEHVPVDIL